jgi:lipopolysaccharide/colanic/teichoic acid biosynthesis glycosyltransferase
LLKRVFDILFSLAALFLLGWVILICLVIASVETGSYGIFSQQRVGQFGQLFTIYKIKTIHPIRKKVTLFGAFFRDFKLDELPQFYNVLIGDMSIVGPRPDVEGYYDLLQGEDRKILELQPGITSEASIKYRNEDQILDQQQNPLDYNNTVIFPDKVKMNLEYYQNRTFFGDLRIILKTVFGSL